MKLQLHLQFEITIYEGDDMSKMVKTYSLNSEIVEQIEKLAKVRRWDLSTVIEVAVEDLFKKELCQPNPLVTFGDAVASVQPLPAPLQAVGIEKVMEVVR